MAAKAERTSLPWPYAATSEELKQRVRDAKVLAVGAGGIGCELLKTLVVSGFKHVEVIDMDTIETSNLNRQFLFRKLHVGHSKSLVAAEAVKQMRPDVRIIAYQGSVMEPRFNIDFFCRFDCVLNGLDNLEARRHINRLCLAAGVPLVESGTAGYLGQVSVHLKGRTECFECQPKPTPRTFPVCTLRNTPDKPIHCVVWAKEMLFPLLFGAPEASDLNEAVAGANVQQAKEAAAAITADDPSFYQRRDRESSRQFAERVFRQMYCTKIEELRGMEDLWHSRHPPQPLDLDALLVPAANISGKEPAAVDATAAAGSACKLLGLTDAHSVWDVQRSAALFLLVVQLFLDGRSDELGSAQFDKDDALAVEFVTAAANLRAACYGIPMQSLFDVKGMAGNIIHAIATTNAIVSGLIVTEALKLLADAAGACQTSFLHQQVSGSKRLVSRMAAPEPNAACLVCGTAQAQLAVDTNKMSLQQLVDKVLKGRLALLAPSVRCGTFAYEEGEGLEEDEVAMNCALLPRLLAELPGGGVVHNSILDIDDQEQCFKAQLVVTHREEWDEQHPEGFHLSDGLPLAQAQQATVAGESTDGAAVASVEQALLDGPLLPAAGVNKKMALQKTDEGVVLLSRDEEEEATEAASAAGRYKRKAAERSTEGSKRARTVPPVIVAVQAEVGCVVDLLDSD